MARLGWHIVLAGSSYLELSGMSDDGWIWLLTMADISWTCQAGHNCTDLLAGQGLARLGKAVHDWPNLVGKSGGT